MAAGEEISSPGTVTQQVPPQPRGRLFHKYALLFAGIVSTALVANGIVDIWFSYRDQTALLIRVQHEQAKAAADKIGQFIKEIEGQLAWTTQLAWNSENIDQRRLEALRLFRQVPAISELMHLDPAGREQLTVSRFSPNVVGSQVDRSQERAFVQAAANKIYHGPVHFRDESEPYMAIALAGLRRENGVSIAEVNLRFIWDVVSQIVVGDGGQVYVVDGNGRLIAHPDISLVLSRTDFSHLAQVRAALSPSQAATSQRFFEGRRGERVLAAHAAIAPLGWLVLVELPVAEAHAPIYASILRSGAVLVAALGFSILAGLALARRMVVPIKTLQRSADSIGGGNLSQRISIKTGDELEALGNRFNSMAEQLEQSYADLERKVQERTHQLELANLAKSRFLAAASHDLRQPMHALGLFISQLRVRLDAAERDLVIGRIDTSLAAMNELFDALLDISKLDAGVLAPKRMDFPIAQLLGRIENTFAAAARQKGLTLKVGPSGSWVRTDFILLERILLNLVANALRYTRRGDVGVSCHEGFDEVRIDVSDSGIGIAEDEQRKIFGEFYRVPESERDGARGLGLGLAIVERLGRLLDHPIELSSKPGEGSCFSIRVPAVAIPGKPDAPQLVAPEISDRLTGKLIVVIDDDELVRDATDRLLQSWGCETVIVASASDGQAAIAGYEQRPDLIISDYRLAGGNTGLEAIAELRTTLGGSIPALLISGDTSPDRLREVRESGFHLLHKPVGPAALRATMNHLLQPQLPSVS